jgi:ABC-2 type transport system ATP-binding protein
VAQDLAIATDGLAKTYRTRWSRREVHAVDDVSIHVRPGATFGLLGPNGAGKTTFVKILLSAVHPTRGSAKIFGRDARETEARRRIGYLPENHRFPTYFTGAGMLDFYAALSGLPAAERRRLIPEMLALVGLEEWGDVRLGKYSKGMLQRVGLAQALIHSPDILILDEPTDGVDPVGRRQIRDILQSLEGKGVTIFINSHQLAEVELFCEEVAILKRGRVALSGTVSELLAGKGFRLSAAGVPERLRTELARNAASICAANGVTDFQFTTREQVNDAIDALRAERCLIEAMVPTSSTLEDVFVKTVEG